MRHNILKFIAVYSALVCALLLPPLATAEEADKAENAAILDARALPKTDVPDPLKSWVPWVLKDQPALACPFAYNASEDRRCVWPAKISLILNSKGGTFSYQVDVFAPAQVDLPGSLQTWPQAVMVNGKPVQVTGQTPRVLLPVGSHNIIGTFSWATTPESLTLPSAIGLVELNMNGKPVVQPNFGENGQLWLIQDGDSAGERAAASQLTVRVNRLIIDEIPVRIVTNIELIASGKNQEVVLPYVVMNGFIPLELVSALPARVEADGKLRVQVRAGRWEINLTARNSAPLMSLASPITAATVAAVNANPVATTAAVPSTTAKPNEPIKNISLPSEEFWAFKAHNEHRLVTLEGLTSVDPQQTTLPKAWRQFPAFVVRPSEVLKFNETKRGDPQPAPDRLALRRNIWLDFDGRGYTVQDQISGAMNSSWRLEMLAPSVLGRAAVGGEDQFITSISKPSADGKLSTVGIEVRKGQASVVADSRIETDARTLSAVGWQKDFNSLAATLHLPPGWRLIAAQGTDSARTTWVSKWTLLDLFLLLMVTLSFGRLFGVKWGVIALAATVLAYHEMGVPIAAWLVTLALIALIRVLPKEGKFAKFIQFGRWASLLFLAVTLLPFMVSQIRQAMYPVLEKKYQAVMSSDNQIANNRMRESTADAKAEMNAANEVVQGAMAAADVAVAANAPMAAPPPPPPSPIVTSEPKKSHSYERSSKWDSKNQQFRLNKFDSKAMIQTGPGLPAWSWNSHPISWSGPVEQGQKLSLVLLSPFWNAVLRIVSVILLGAMLLCVLELIKRWPIGLTPKQSDDFSLAGFKDKWRKGKTSGQNHATVASIALTVFALIFGAMLSTHSTHAHAQMPTPELLEQLKGKLNVAPSCLPNCASIPRMFVSANGEAIALRLEIHANEDVAVPLPGGAKDWHVAQVLLNGKAASGLHRDSQGTLWIQVPRGVQQVQMLGAGSELDVIALALPLKPNRVESQLQGWTLDGVNDNAQADNSLTLSRVASAKSRSDSSGDTKQGSIAPFFKIERTLELGLQWQMTTTVTRLSPANSPVSLEVALLDGESITTSEPRSEKGRALISMAPQATEVSWESTLIEVPELTLVAGKQANQFEVWRLNPGTQWHFVLSGIAVTAHQEGNSWAPKWQPWPGETVKISASKPMGVAGQTLTIDSSIITVKPGARATDSVLDTTLRSSRGGQHVIQLPEGSSLQNVVINGQSQPIRLVGREVRLPLLPGTQRVQISWRQSVGIGTRFVTPLVNLNAPSVNARVQMQVPTNRWTLFVSGPIVGPAVLIWGVLIVLVAVAFGLGKVPFTPLRMLQWALLGIGFTQVHPIVGAFFVGWLIILGLRKTHWPNLHPIVFNLGQIALFGWTVIALAALVWAVSRGLLGSPNMQISGNGSTSHLLSWFADRTGNELPITSVLSVPLWVYRGLMLLWALWLAYSLLKWLKWSWECFTTNGYWRAMGKAAKQGTATPDQTEPVNTSSEVIVDAPNSITKEPKP